MQRAWYSSKAWLQRQARDPYVKAAKSNQYRARSAFKLIQLDQKYKLIRRGNVVVDVGAAPGGFTQVAVNKGATVIGVDLLPIEPIPHAHLIQGDFTQPSVQKTILDTLEGRSVDLVCSDMAPSFSGNHTADHARSMELCEAVFAFAETVLAPNGSFITKLLMGGDEVQYRKKLKTRFRLVKQEKPDASRKQSTEVFIVAKGYKKDINN
ncbi:ribosomal RNA large subunit methyltransferase J [Lichtheimia hyalospora FSU 10163]|nr:ribosomal RNA large subunit methyltransferase J [Lichtheimia hyalospora FSU 10163]